MTEEEVEAVAEELAKAGGISWYPGRTVGPLLRVVHERYRDRARIAIATLERLRGAGEEKGTQLNDTISRDSGQTFEAVKSGNDQIRVGAIVVYRPPGERRAIPCRVERLEDGRAYLIPCPKPDLGWVSIDSLSLSSSTDESGSDSPAAGHCQ